MSNELDRAVVSLCDALTRYYPSVYRYDDDSSIRAVRFWKKNLNERIAPEKVAYFTDNYLGQSPFESHPPRPQHLIDFMSKEGDESFNQAVQLDEMLAAFYLSLYPKEVGIRLNRINEVAQLFREHAVNQAETDILIKKVKKGSEWRSYPPSMYDIINIVIRCRLGIESCDQEFLNYCQSIDTPAVSYIAGVIRRDNLRALNLDRLSAVFKKIYYALEDSGWPDIESYRNHSRESNAFYDEESGSKEETHSIIIR